MHNLLKLKYAINQVSIELKNYNPPLYFIFSLNLLFSWSLCQMRDAAFKYFQRKRVILFISRYQIQLWVLYHSNISRSDILEPYVSILEIAPSLNNCSQQSLLRKADKFCREQYRSVTGQKLLTIAKHRTFGTYL